MVSERLDRGLEKTPSSKATSSRSTSNIWAASTDWLLDPANHDETIRLLVDREGLSAQRAEHAYHRVVPKGCINPDAIRRNLELRIELGLYPPPHHTAEHFYDTSYWCAATGLAAPKAVGAPASAA